MQKLSDEEIISRDCCGNCANYIPFIKKGTEFLRGQCKIRNRYKQRTELCKKFIRSD